MDEERLTRARALGFDTSRIWHHGANEDIRRFSKAKLGETTGNKAAQSGFFFTSNRHEAGLYSRLAQGAPAPHTKGFKDKIISIYGPKHVKEFDVLKHAQAVNKSEGLGITKMTPHQAMEIMGVLSKWVPAEAAAARAEGFKGIVFKNIMDDPHAAFGGKGTPSDHLVVFDPKNIRSPDAAFNPKLSDSRNIMASRIAPMAGIGLGLLAVNTVLDAHGSAAHARESGSNPTAAAGKTAAVTAATVAASVAATGATAAGIVKYGGMGVLRATGVAGIGVGAVVGAVQGYRSGEGALMGAAKGAIMGSPVGLAIGAHQLAQRVGSPPTPPPVAGSNHRVLTVTEAQRYEQAQKAYEAMQASSSPSTMQREIEVGGYTRKHQTPAGNIVAQSVEQHTRGRPIRR